MEKPTAAAIDAFADAFPDDARATQKKMFGMPAGFINGNMFGGVFGNGVTMRLAGDRLAEVKALEGVGDFEPMHGRPWKDYAFADATVHGGSSQLRDWMAEALEHTAKMPAKKPKARKKK